MSDFKWEEQDEDLGKERIYTFLDGLRRTGDTNMHDSVRYLQAEFLVGRGPAKQMVAAWMADVESGAHVPA